MKEFFFVLIIFLSFGAMPEENNNTACNTDTPHTAIDSVSTSNYVSQNAEAR